MAVLSFYNSNGTTLAWQFNAGASPDVNPQGVHALKLRISAKQPMTLAFSCFVPQHTIPYTLNDFVQFFDDRYSTTAPVFEGHVRRTSPSEDPNIVNVECHGSDARVAEEIFVANTIMPNGTAIPRVIYNCTEDADEDFGNQQLTYFPIVTPYGSTAVFATAAQIITDLVANQQAVLYNLHAGPADGVTTSLVQSDLTTFDMQPQEKISFDSVNLMTAIQQVLDLYPAYRMLFDPTTRQFRIYAALDAPTTTLVLNQAYSGGFPVPHPVLSMKLDVSIDKRFTAFRLVGKPEVAFADCNVYSGTLTPLAIPSDPLGRGIPGSFRRWRVTDPTKRHLARFILPGQWIPVVVPQGNAGLLLTYFFYDQPALLASWDGRQSYQVVNQFNINVSQGYFETPYYLYKTNPSTSSGPETYTLPDDVRAVFDYYTAQIYLRWPASGFAGTAFDQFGVQVERLIYHELLNTGFLKWDKTTQQEKITQYTKLAKQALRAYQDTVYTGGATLFGIDYQYARLNKRICFTAVDSSNNPLTTGWENANAPLTDVEYDYEGGFGTTTLTFNSDLSQYVEDDVNKLRARLKIRAQAVYRQFWNFNMGIGDGGVGLSMGWQTVKVGEKG